MKGSAITGPVGKEAAELWPVSSLPTTTSRHSLTNPSVLPATPVSSCKVLACERKSRKDKRACGAWWLGFCPECDQIERGKETFIPLPQDSYSFFIRPGRGEGLNGECSFYLLLLKSLDLAQGSCISVAACKDDSHTRQAFTSRTKQKSLQNDFPGRCVLLFWRSNMCNSPRR